MGRPGAVGWAVVSLAAVAAPGRSVAQVTLADDIIVAARSKQKAEENKERSSLGRKPGTAASPYRRSPGSNDIDLGTNPPRRPSTLARPERLARLPANPSPFRPPEQEPIGEHGFAPAVERLRLPGRPGSEVPGPDEEIPPEDEGPAEGLTLDVAIERLVRENRELRIKALEIPQAEADVLTAGLRENPLFFYSTGGVPYGGYSRQRTGDVESGISLVFPIDYTGKRRARVEVAKKEHSILGAQYQNAVRLAIDELYGAFVDALAARQSAYVTEDSLRLIDELMKTRRAGPAPSEADLEAAEDLIIQRDVAAMSVEDARERLEKAKERLGQLLELTPVEVDALNLRGRLRVGGFPAPPADELIDLAIRHRPDLAGFRLGIDRACAEVKEQKTEQLSDAYFLYTPFDYHDRSRSGQLSVNTWGAGVFVSLPIFNRNQGNLRRARLNVVQTRNEASHAESRVIAEVRQAIKDLEHTQGDVDRLEDVTLPAVRRKRERARARYRAGELGAEGYLEVQRETSELVRYYRQMVIRHRRNMLRLNTAVGLRVLP